MEKLNINKENFEQEVLESNKTVLLDFYANWCGPCLQMSPIIEEIANEKTDLKVAKINIDVERELAIQYEVEYIPTLIVIKNGKEINRLVGVVSKKQIEESL